MKQFIAFIGDRPIIAHNAHFDVGFMTAAALRHGLRFNPVFLDTLALSQALLPELKRFKLDIVSNHLNLPQFNHHRATDDAMVVARIMEKFLPMLQQQGAKTVDDIETVYHSLRRTDVAKTHHMILLVKNRKGLKNLYEMVSQSYLKYFHRSVRHLFGPGPASRDGVGPRAQLFVIRIEDYRVGRAAAVIDGHEQFAARPNQAQAFEPIEPGIIHAVINFTGDLVEGAVDSGPGLGRVRSRLGVVTTFPPAALLELQFVVHNLPALEAVTAKIEIFLLISMGNIIFAPSQTL